MPLASAVKLADDFPAGSLLRPAVMPYHTKRDFP